VAAADTDFVAPTDSELPAPEEEYYTLTELIEEKALRGRAKKLKKGQKQQQHRDDKVVELQDKVRSQQEAMDKLKLQVKVSGLGGRQHLSPTIGRFQQPHKVT
jgi:hypothetical protein